MSRKTGQEISDSHSLTPKTLQNPKKSEFFVAIRAKFTHEFW
jgi:hypothetical protein